MGQTAEELLGSLTDEQIAAYTADPASEEHIVVGADRFIVVPSALKRIAVQHDHNIETVTFDCPRYWDGHDMSKMVVYINYMRPDNARGSYAATDVTVDEADDSIMHFNWTISGNVTEIKGKLSFLICVKKADSQGNMVNHWNSELNQEMYISEGLECGEPIFEQYPDLITQLLLKMDELGKLLVISDDGNGNVNIEGLNTTLNIAETFSDKATYEVGEYVMFYGTLFKCIEPVTAYGMWKAANWKEVTIVDELKECFQYVSDGKTLIASAIIDMGVQTGATDTFEKMATNIRSIKTGVAAGGTAEVGDVTKGKTFINQTGQLLTGTSTAAADLANLQTQYNTVVADKNTLQGQYDAVVNEKNAIQASYNEYKNAVVTGLANSGLGVTSATTASELQAILLTQYPACTPYEVNFADYPVSLDDCGNRRDNNVNEQFTNENGKSFYMQVTDGDEGGSFAQLGGSVALQTKGCDKVDVSFETVGRETTIAGLVINPSVNPNGTRTFDCSGSTFNLGLQVTEAAKDHTAYVRITKVRFYSSSDTSPVPYDVAFGDYGAISVSDCERDATFNADEQCSSLNGTCLYLSLRQKEDTWGTGKLVLRLPLNTKRCNKVDITYENGNGDNSINGQTLSGELGYHTLTFDCTGSTFNLVFQVLTVGGGICNSRITRIRFYCA